MVVVQPMKNPFHATTGPRSGVLPRFTRINRLIKGMAGILMALLFQSTAQVHAQTSQGSYKVKLAWNASISKDVTGYRIHYGTTSGTYTTSIVLGNVTSSTVSGLAEGVTYHFAVSAFNAAGLESGVSNEVNFMPGQLALKISTTATTATDTTDAIDTTGTTDTIDTTGTTLLTVRGLIGRQYDIEASVDLNTWILIDTVTLPDGGMLKFSDPDSASYPQRFYRTSQR
jgi:hypothetical protein